MYKRILIAVDDSETSNRALREASGLARDQHAVLRIVHVVDRVALIGSAPLADPAESEKTWGEIASDILERAQGAARAEGVDAETRLLETTDVEDRIAQAILGEATRWGADLLVAGTHGRSGLKHLLMGSVAEGIVRHAPMPVLLVRGA
jgi:nucleotide-binding universal stress UspA family protein